ncbi:MAG: PQQ-dependent dehydrogenase, methanol/ethanol family, partial [Acidobacteriota bacterium]
MTKLCSGIFLLTVAALAQQSRPVNDAALRNAAPGEWLNYGRDYAETHYSPLNQITAANVAQMKPAWSLEMGTPAGPLETTPIVSNGVMFVTGNWDVVLAIDVRTGKLKWSWDPMLPRTGGPRLCCGSVNRGVALYNNKIYIGLLDARLVALNAETGKPVWDVQTSVDLKESYSITGAPRVVKGKVIIGNGGAENAVRGYFTAYDAETGKIAWRFFTVPGDPSKPFENPELAMAAKTWTGEWWKYGGGGTPWDGFAYDAEADLLYIGTGNGGPWDRNFRSPGGGDNLFLSSILAVKPETGKMVWYFQQVPGDQWDYTTVQPMILADLRINGRNRKVLMQAPKNGFFYVIDRLTGEFISAKQYSRATWAVGLDEKTGRPIETPEARYGKTLVTLSPGPVGAHNWQPMAFHPGTGLVYFPAQMSAFEYGIDAEYVYNKGGRNLGVIARPGALPRVEGEAPPANSWFVAWDPVAQKEKWRVNYTGGSGSGTLATAGNLVFQATPQGMLVGYNAATGEKLWEGQVGAGAATPVSYRVDGRQYVAIA